MHTLLCIAICVRVIAQHPGQYAQPVGDDFGSGLLATTDLNGDGVADFVVSDPYRRSGHDREGWIGAVSGKDQELLWEAWGGALDAHLGQTIHAIGDVDQDGTQDLTASVGYFAQRLFSAKSGEALFDFPAVTVTSSGDLDGDRVPDLIALTRSPASEWPTVQGRREPRFQLALLKGRDGSLIRCLQEDIRRARTGTNALVLEVNSVESVAFPDGDPLRLVDLKSGVELPTWSGGAILAIEDLHADQETLVAAHTNEGRGQSSLVLLDSKGQVVKLCELTGPDGNAPPQLSIARLGDVDSDGFKDILLGHHGTESGPSPAGIYSGASLRRIRPC